MPKWCKRIVKNDPIGGSLLASVITLQAVENFIFFDEPSIQVPDEIGLGPKELRKGNSVVIKLHT